MSYLKSDGADAVVEWPYSYAAFRRDNPGVSFPRAVTDEWLEGYNIFKVAPSAQPAYDPAKNIEEVEPQRIDGVWTQVWTQVNASPAEIAARQKQAALDAEKDAAHLDPWITAYLNMTPSGAEQYVLNNVTNLATARDVMSKLAYAVRVLIKREFNR